MDTTSDAELLARMARRDEAALRLTIERYGAVVFGAARWLVRDEGIAEEVAQDTFIALWKRPGAVDPAKGNLRSFLTGIAKYKAIDRIRSASSAARTLDAVATVHPVASDISDAVVERRALIEALDRLSEVQREALVLAYLGGRTYKEVAVELAIPEGTAKTRLRDGLKALRANMSRVEANA